jgi:hypothetical protein
MASKKKSINKTAYIMKFPKLSANELVAKAKKDGIEIGEKYVYNIRSKAKGNGGAKRKPGRPPGKVNGSRRVSGASSQEEQFANIALDIGLGKAEKLLSDIRQAAQNAAN